MIYQFQSTLCWIWKHSPAFFLSVHFLLGIGFFLSWNICLVFLHICLVTLFLRPNIRENFQVAFICFCLFFLGIIHAKIHLKHEKIDNIQIEGNAIFSPKSVKLQKTIFNSSYVYNGKIKLFSGEEGTNFFNIPCTVLAPKKEERPSADSDYFFYCKLEKTPYGTFSIKPSGPWKKIQGTFSFAERRFSAKKNLQKFINKQFSNKRVVDFLYALCSGEIEDKMLLVDFSRLGLQHILAVSGFHFSLLSIFFGFIFYRIFPKKIASLLLIFLLSFYFFFLGFSASVFRAWLAITLWSLSKIIQRKNNGVNTLGVCLLTELIFFPQTAFQMGFQFSFLCTAAILLVGPQSLKLMQIILPVRSKQQIDQLSKLEKIAYLFCSCIRGTLALTISVNLACIPLCLYHFKTFPLLSLVFNLFFPFITGIIMFSFLIGSILSFILPALSKIIFLFSSFLASFLLDLASHPPKLLGYNIKVQSLPIEFIYIYLFLFFLILSREREKYV